VGVRQHEGKKQQQFVGHTEDVVCMGLHPSKKIVATGQRDPKGSGTPFFCVWDTVEMKQLQKIQFHEREVQALEFSHCGKYVMSIGGDDSHSFAIFEWAKSPEPLLKGMTAKSQVFGLTKNPYCTEYVMEFAAFGQSFLKFMRVSKGPGDTLLMDQAIPSAPELKDVKSYHCATYRADGSVLVGTDNGLLLVFIGNNLVKSFQAHRDPIGAIVAKADGSFLTGGHDGKIINWTADYVKGEEITIPDMYGSEKKDPDVTSMDLCEDATGGAKLVIGLKRSMIYEYKFADKSMNLVQKGNFDEIWALATHPTLQRVAWGGNDGLLACWDVTDGNRTCVWTKIFDLKASPRSCTFNGSGDKMAVGLKDGSVAYLNAATGETTQTLKVCKEQIDAIAYHPTTEQVAAGSWDQNIALIDGEGKVTTMTGHSSSVTHIQYSSDGSTLMTNSKDYEILFWDAHGGKQMPSKPKINSWRNWNCILGWPCQGLFAPGLDGTDVNVVQISGSDDNGDDKGKKVLVTGTDDGRIMLRRYPSLSSKAPYIVFHGHSSFVTNLRFSAKSELLFSAGGNDLAMMEWSIDHNVKASS
jgi:WD40 repeat protein